jgi:basic amino acid/polyamine antiporter, APA family
MPELKLQQPNWKSSARSRLTLWDAVSIIIGIVIGAGIYETPPLVLSNVSGPGELFAVWLVGGVLSLIGAACYAELASAYPRSGGDYVYLTRAFAPVVGFLFGWAQLSVILTGSIGMLAYVFADYSMPLFGLDAGTATALATGSVLVLSVLNMARVSLGKAAQNAMTLVKLAGIAAVVAAGLFLASSAPSTPSPQPRAPHADGSFGLAMILVLYTFGGWNDAAYVAAEVRDPRRNLPRALLLGTAIVTLAYLLMNAAFVFGLGFEQARQSKAIAADVLLRALGPVGAKLMSVLVLISALSAMNGLIFTGSRVYGAVGSDYSALAWLGRWQRLGSPIGALLAQLVLTLGLIGTVGTSLGRSTIDGLVARLGLSSVEWSGHGGFDTLLRCTAPVFWLFFLLTGISVFVLRYREPGRRRPFCVPLYPILPLVFCGTCAFMLYSAFDYAGKLSVIGLALLLPGLPLYFASRHKPAPLPGRTSVLASGAK